jgi:DNA-binding NarL/FixJ family response regulator
VVSSYAAAELPGQDAREQLVRREQVDRGLARLRRVVDQDELLEAGCRVAATSGDFERVMLSRVDDGVWAPLRGFAVSAGPAERAFLEWVRSEPRIRLSRTLVEGEVVRHHEPALVLDAHEEIRVSRSFARPAALTSYVVAPIVVDGRAIGLLHAGGSLATVTEADRQTLAAFAVGFSVLFERAVLVARLRAQRAEVARAMAVMESVLDQLAADEVRLVASSEVVGAGHGMPRPPPRERPVAIDGLLTTREREVLALMATGATNERIAQRLVIATGTVKSHVKQILRKLRVENRAEAISQYLRQQPGL